MDKENTNVDEQQKMLTIMNELAVSYTHLTLPTTLGV